MTLSADLIAITETGCNSSISDAELVPKGYSIQRCDRKDGRKQGGVLVAATNRFELRRICLSTEVDIDKSMFELLGVQVLRNNKLQFILCVLYIPPQSPTMSILKCLV